MMIRALGKKKVSTHCTHEFSTNYNWKKAHEQKQNINVPNSPDPRQKKNTPVNVNTPFLLCLQAKTLRLKRAELSKFMQILFFPLPSTFWGSDISELTVNLTLQTMVSAQQKSTSEFSSTQAINTHCHWYALEKLVNKITSRNY